MLFRTKSTIDEDELEWQLDCWEWLLENLGGIQSLIEHPTLIPSKSNFPSSGKKGYEHAQHVFEQVAQRINIDPSGFELVEQEENINPILSTFAVVQGAPIDAAGTYKLPEHSNKHIITYAPDLLANLEKLIAVFAHEICHPILLNIPTPPPGAENDTIIDGVDYAEEYATDLATAFMGFGIFNGNSAFKFEQFSDIGSGSQGWQTDGLGYLKVHEWSFALAIRTILMNETTELVTNYGSQGLVSGYKKNLKFLQRNMNLVSHLKT